MTATFVYVVVYTHLMKRRTPDATVIGGISGALPPVIGYTAVSGRLPFEAMILFLIMFIWQPPHFWLLAIKYAEDYKRANPPSTGSFSRIHRFMGRAGMLGAILTSLTGIDIYVIGFVM